MVIGNNDPLAIRMYTEVFCYIAMEKLEEELLSRQESNRSCNLVEVRLNPRFPTGTIEFSPDTNQVYLRNVSYQKIFDFMSKNLGSLTWERLNACKIEGYLFEFGTYDFRNKVEKTKRAFEKTKKAFSEPPSPREDKNKLDRRRVEMIVALLNSAGIICKKPQRGRSFFSSPIKTKLQGLDNNSKKNFIRKICGAGGTIDRYLAIEEGREPLSIVPAIKESMQTIFYNTFGGKS